jgi:pilus assembly protein Flp/PilA
MRANRREIAVLSNYCRDEAGATAIEYGLIAAMIGMVIIAAIGSTGGAVDQLYNTLMRIDDAMSD